ncbi:MAG TPA: adenylate/guanylate cyclase domain-containing protein, partial [Chthonomonadales bacterium]|nr:adenylate/guanylate cyclase domain-containing protein [Chthonomonadales bacterium]
MEARNRQITFLLTDVEGSTRLWEKCQAAMGISMARHDQLAAAVVAWQEGDIVKPRGEGDSLFVVFEDSRRAVQAAVELQRAFAAEPWPAEAPVLARMAIHQGDAEFRDGDYYGPVVNRAARLRAIAHGGQIILSESVRSAIESSYPPQVTLRDLGFHRLKDLQQPERVYQVVSSDIQADFPPLRSLQFLANNLPQQVSTFVGRATELRKTAERMRAGRLITIVGPGGSGKTRLALQASADEIDNYADGVWLVELASVTDSRLVSHAVAA